MSKCGGISELWYAVDRDGEKWLYSKEPTRREEDGYWYAGLGISLEEHDDLIPESILPDTTWEDNPVKISLLLDYAESNRK